MGSGRKPGYSPSEEARKKSMNSSPRKRRVKTPFGEFISIFEAARQLNIDSHMVSYKCNHGHDGWEFLTPSPKPKRPVITPYGTFPSIHAASRAEGVTAGAIVHKLKYRDDYNYIDE